MYTPEEHGHMDALSFTLSWEERAEVLLRLTFSTKGSLCICQSPLVWLNGFKAYQVLPKLHETFCFSHFFTHVKIPFHIHTHTYICIPDPKGRLAINAAVFSKEGTLYAYIYIHTYTPAQKGMSW